MEISIEFQQGPITATIEATEEDDVINVLNDIATFLEENPHLNEPSISSSFPEISTDQDEKPIEDEGEEEDYENEMLAPLLEQTDMSEEEFIRLVEVHKEVTPRLLQEERLPAKGIGEKITNAALVLLTVYQECYEEDWMKSSDLSDSLSQSGLNDRTDYIYNQDGWQSYFDKEGEGRGTKLRVTRLGKDKAIDLINEMAT